VAQFFRLGKLFPQWVFFLSAASYLCASLFGSS
jgi:hypothetical protein